MHVIKYDSEFLISEAFGISNLKVLPRMCCSDCVPISFYKTKFHYFSVCFN
jgi:hypothetical protein